MSSSDSDLELETAGLSKLLPMKSKVKYLQAYDTFVKWKKKNQKDSLDESVFLDYFLELSDKRKPSSLWAIYSMLKCTIHLKHNISIQNYAKLTWFLKKKSRGYKCVVSKSLTEENIKTFLRNAPDDIYLATKVALILAICGACRSGELVTMTTKNIKKHGDVLVVTNTDRVFVIPEDLTPLVEKYIALRPKHLETDRFFLKYRDGKCIKQVVGRHKISSMPKDIATFLQLPNPKSYTGHCFRRSATGYSGVNVVVGNKRKRGNFVTDREDVTESTIDAQTHNQNITDTDDKNKKQKDDTGTDGENIPDESTQDIQVVIEDNKSPIVKSLRHVRASQAFASSTLTELEMEFDRDSDDMSEDPIHIKTENVDETINSRPQGDLRVISQPSGSNEKLHVTSDENNTNIRIAGKNINIIFKNCAKVGNVTINIIKD
ncbi:hypothetical protein MSG28_008542 [Choristoneura fumiferana]|uniref:Uncharacterized protein n=1 Tax=Choristoneura fumiferana TaxID=7141 RepID=A0ACC0J766_CHOFU|nr:hypothetical protein MSG28_008542 [Choristoneura fumiferana]